MSLCHGAASCVLRPASSCAVNFSFKQLLLKNGWTDQHQTWWECSLGGAGQVLYIFTRIGTSKMAAVASDWLRHFKLLLKNGWTDRHQTWWECSSTAATQVLYKFMRIWKSKMAAVACILIGWDHFVPVWRTAERINSKLGTVVPYDVPHKCCYFSRDSEKSKMAAITRTRIGWHIFSFLSRMA